MRFFSSIITIILLLVSYTSISQVKVLRPGATTKISNEQVEMIGNYHDNTLNSINWNWDFWFGSNLSYNNSNYDRGNYIALYRKKYSRPENIVILEVSGKRRPGFGSELESSDYYQFNCSPSDLTQLYNHIKNTFKRENFENKDYALSLELGDSIKVDIRRTAVSARKLAVIGVSSDKSGSYFFISEKGVDLLFGKSKAR
jgi:hypothetical protein